MKYHKLVENARKPKGFWGKLMINSMNKGHSELTDWALEILNIKNGDAVLDLGCGGGKTVYKLCKLTDGKVSGIDYSELCVKNARKLNQSNIRIGKAEILQASVSSLPFDDSCFDKIIAVETYYFWPDKLNDLKEALRVLKRGGKIMLVFEMLEDKENPGKWSAVESKLGIKAVSAGGIAEALAQAGFTEIETYINQEHDWLCASARKE